MLRNANYIYNNCIIADEINTTKKYCKRAQVGVDLTVKNIFELKNRGEVNCKETITPKYESLMTIEHNSEYKYYLKKGTYIVELNEGIKLNKNDTGLIIMRSSLNRCGVTIHSAVWDPGYSTIDKEGNIKTMSIRMTVENENGFIVEKNARICQILIFENEDTNLYEGQWQGGKNNL